MTIILSDLSLMGFVQMFQLLEGGEVIHKRDILLPAKYGAGSRHLKRKKSNDLFEHDNDQVVIAITKW